MTKPLMSLSFRLVALLCALAAPAAAGVSEAVQDHAIPATQAFADSAAELAQTAQTDCRAAALRPAYQATFDDWMGIRTCALAGWRNRAAPSPSLSGRTRRAWCRAPCRG